MKKYENLKKVELHCHFDGSLSPALVSKWTKKSVSEIIDKLRLQRHGDLNEYLKMFDYPISLLQSKQRLKEAAQALCRDLIKDSVIYAEIRFDPLSHTKKDLSVKEVIDAVLEGINSTSLKAKLILCMKRERDDANNKIIIDVARKYLKKGVAAVDLSGSEIDYPLRKFKTLFQYAKEQDVPFVIHAGEVGDATEIKTAISYGASRIGHGVQAIKSFEVMEKLKELDIPLEICLTSNVHTRLYERYSDHPVMRLVDSGVKITINTDNRTISNTTLTDEYNLLNKYFGFNITDFVEMNKYAINHSFLSEKEKEEMLLQLDQKIKEF